MQVQVQVLVLRSLLGAASRKSVHGNPLNLPHLAYWGTTADTMTTSLNVTAVSV